MSRLALVLPLSLIFSVTIGSASAQTGALSGFVTDATDGQPLPGATIVLSSIGDGSLGPPEYGTSAASDGIYYIRNVALGQYAVRVTFVGYDPYVDTLSFDSDNRLTLEVELYPTEASLGEVVVEGARESGAARVTAGHQRIRPDDLELVPSTDLSADLGSYLSTLPGIVSTGDRGGQFFVRGGEPSQNLVLVDGITIYQPFHVVGSYSAIPADIVDRVDLYAGGYDAHYAGRLSSVIDVAGRAGNNRSFAGKASASPFAGSVLLEGPVIPGRLSFIASARQAFINRTGQFLYGEDMPFWFNDAFGKLHFAQSGRSRISISGIRTYDRGRLGTEVAGSEPQTIRWRNQGYSIRWLFLPRALDVSTDLVFSRSRHEMQQGEPGETVRSTHVETTHISLNADFFRERTVFEAGWDVEFSSASNDLGGLFQNLESSRLRLPSFGLFLEPEFRFGGARIEPGLRVQWYNVGIDPYLEPRIRALWERGTHTVSGALGIYNQQIIGLSDRRDAAGVFTAWAGIPRRDQNLEENTGEDVDRLRLRIGQAVHAVAGYRVTPADWVEFSVEGFYKRLTNLFIGEWSAIPRLTTRLQPGRGRTFGIEFRAEMRRRPFYGYLTYGLSNTAYVADAEAINTWYGENELRYRPAHDRRHQVNALISYTWHDIELNARWMFGSGLPYTHPLAFDEFVLIDDIRAGQDTERWRRVIYDRPFGSVMPSYHRLDVSVRRTFDLRSFSVTLQGSVLNAYNRRNIFYYDTFTLERQDQLPIVPSLSMEVAFE